MRFEEDMAALVQIMLSLDEQFAAAKPGAARSHIRQQLEKAQGVASDMVARAYRSGTPVSAPVTE